MKYGVYLFILLITAGCSVKKNNIFSRSYHQLTTRYNIYFNGDQALKAGIKKMDQNHKEDYTSLLPVFISSDDQVGRTVRSDMEYAMEKALRAIDEHSITVKPKRKEAKGNEAFREKKEYNNQLDLCYLLLSKSLFYQKKYAMANNTFRSIQRHYAYDKEIATEAALWMFRSYIEMHRYNEAKEFMQELDRARLNGEQREIYAAAKTDFYIRQNEYLQAIAEAERLTDLCRDRKNKSRYRFLLSQLYMRENRAKQAMSELRKVGRFNFDYEMVFNARINRALAFQEGDKKVTRTLNRMLRDVKNVDYRDRIYYALANIEEKKGDEGAAVDLYWKSVRSSVNNDNQQSLSFRELGDYYLKEQNYVSAQACYDSCLFLMDSRHPDYSRLKGLVTDLTDLVVQIKIIQEQDSLQRLATMSVNDRMKLIDGIIQEVRSREEESKREINRMQEERNFYDRNNMLGQGGIAPPRSGSEWYFYNPVTVSVGKNDFNRKWGRRKQEDNWRRQNKAMVDFIEPEVNVVETGGNEKERANTKSRDYYLKNLPLTPELLEISDEKTAEAYHKAGEIYIYRFENYKKALECFEAYIERFPDGENLPLLYYLACDAAEKLGDKEKAQRYRNRLTGKFPQSDYAKGITDPDYFKKVNQAQQAAERMYEDAYSKYQQVRYEEALAVCNDILEKYPESVLNQQVLFLKAMCVVNVHDEQKAKNALNLAIATKPDEGMLEVLQSVLSMISAGKSPVLGMEEAVRKEQEDVSGPAMHIFSSKEGEKHNFVLLLPFRDLNTKKIADDLRNIERAFVLVKEDYDDKREMLIVQNVGTKEQAMEYMSLVMRNKSIIDRLSGVPYQAFAITQQNQTVLLETGYLEEYLKFFEDSYMSHAGETGIGDENFAYNKSIGHKFVLFYPNKADPFKLKSAFEEFNFAGLTINNMKYDDSYDCMVVSGFGNKDEAMRYFNTMVGNQKILKSLKDNDYASFIITEMNLKVMREKHLVKEYLEFFKKYYLQ